MTKAFGANRPLGRGSYAALGVALFALKHNIDRLIAAKFGYPWSPFNYWAPLGRVASILSLTALERRFLTTMLLAAVPFIVVGVVLSLRRLRSAGWPGWLVFLFFVPWVNLVFFLLLSLAPSGSAGLEAMRPMGTLDRLIPEGKYGSAAFSLALSVPLGVAMVWVTVSGFATYGWGLFVGVPFMIGLGADIVYCYHGRRTLAQCIGVSLLANLLVGAGLFLVAMEGFGCLLMAAPMDLAIALLAGFAGYWLQFRPNRRAESPAYLGLLVFLVPGLVAMESTAARPAPLLRVTSSIEVDAEPAEVWRHVISFPELPPPDEALFRAGIAYPVRARIEGTGPGAVRRCEFTTGPFIEPIEVWSEPHLLKFSVTANPEPMQEWSPYRHVAPHHLRGYFVAREGQFLLTALPGGRTRLEGTTWYQQRLWPSAYWRVWSDGIVHRIHLRVLRHVKALSEARNRPPNAASFVLR